MDMTGVYWIKSDRNGLLFPLYVTVLWSFCSVCICNDKIIYLVYKTSPKPLWWFVWCENPFAMQLVWSHYRMVTLYPELCGTVAQPLSMTSNSFSFFLSFAFLPYVIWIFILLHLQIVLKNWKNISEHFFKKFYFSNYFRL